MGSSRTAEYVALYRALETEERRRQPLFQDPLAKAFLPRGLRAAVGLSRIQPLRTLLERYADHRAPGARSSAICRTRFIDDVVRREVKAGAAQLVILGAGFDCRAHRLSELRDVQTFEVDRPETQARKRSILEETSPSNGKVTYVEVDFRRDDLGERLASAGWNSAARTLFVWEGVSNYLNESAVSAVLAFVGKSAPSSALVFTYLHRGVLDGTAHFDGADKLIENVRRLGEPWTFGIDPTQTAAFVGRFGLDLEEDLGADQYRTLYAWGAGMRGYGFYRIAFARVRPSREAA